MHRRCRRAFRRCDERSPGPVPDRRSFASCRPRPGETARRHAGRKSGRMPIPVSLTTISTCEFTRSRRTCTRPFFGVNFTAFDTRFQTTCCRRPGSPDTGPTRGSTIVWIAYALGVGGGLDGRHSVVDDQRQFHWLHIQANLPRHDSRNVEDVLDDLRQPRGVAFESFETARGLLARQDAAAQQSRIADDGVQRRAQFVRQHGEELVLHPVRGLRICVEPGVLQRHRSPRRHAKREPLVLLGEHADLGVAEEQATQDFSR